MTDQARLERHYRRVLACYPKAFRRESEDEILAVLLSTAREGQRRAGLPEAADLIMGAVRMHLGLSRAPRPVRNAVRLMCFGAVLTLADAVIVLVTLSSVRSAAVQDVDFIGGRWHTFMLTQVVPVLAGAPIAAGVWLWLAGAAGRGHHWARLAFTALCGLLTIGLLIGLSEGAISGDALPVTWPDIIVTTMLWAVGLAALLLTFSATAGPYYQQKPAQQEPAQQ
jgi:hypothetical protein